MSTLTDEEKTAIKLIDLLSDLRHDLDLIGYYFASLASKTIMIRFDEVIESAYRSAGEVRDRREYHEELIRLGKD